MCSLSATNGRPASADSPPGAGFPSSRRLRKRADFQRVYQEGERVQSTYFSAIFRARGDDGAARVGLTVSRKIGKANVRNLAKRRIRETVRTRWASVPTGVDVVFHARQRIREVDQASLEGEVDRVLRKARQLRAARSKEA